MNPVQKLACAAATVAMLFAVFFEPTGIAHGATLNATFSVSNCGTVVSPTHGTNCGTNLRATIMRLPAGATLKISPGTYDVGQATLQSVTGTAGAPVIVTAANSAAKPLLRGYTLVTRSQYITFSYIDFQATVSKLPALEFLCGVGWKVEDAHIFGAQQTGSFANMQVSGRQFGPPNPDTGGECTSGPSGFVISNDIFSNPYTDPTLNTSADPTKRMLGTEYHDLYLSFEGSNQTGGLVEHNDFIGNLNGAGIKLQDGKYKTIGPWHVNIRYNTFYNGQRAVYLLDDVRYNTIFGNLIDDMSGGGGYGGSKVGVVTDDVVTNTNTLSHTYAYGVAHVSGDVRNSSATLQDLGDNQIRSSPNFVSYILQPGTVLANEYGAFSAETFG